MHVEPTKVISPKLHWLINAVLLDGGEGNCAYAIGTWNGEPRIGFRWNGTTENPIGNPQSRGLPTWTMLDPKLHEAVLDLLPPAKQSLARRFLGTALTFDAVTTNSDRSSIVLWNVRARPPVVAVVACSLIRDVLRRPTMSENDCRLVADVNKELLSAVADRMFREHRHKMSDDQKVRVIEVGKLELEPIAAEFSTSVLEVSALSGWR